MGLIRDVFNRRENAMKQNSEGQIAKTKPDEGLMTSNSGSVTLTPVTREQAVDHGIEESFPASDPVSVSITKVLVASDNDSPDVSSEETQSSDETKTSDQPANRDPLEPWVAAPALNPGDEAAEGTAGTGQTFCPDCGGSGIQYGRSCKTCGGTGEVTVGIGGA